MKNRDFYDELVAASQLIGKLIDENLNTLKTIRENHDDGNETSLATKIAVIHSETEKLLNAQEILLDKRLHWLRDSI